jgi:riboflavin synthase
MFTGIIKSLGKILNITRINKAKRIRIKIASPFNLTNHNKKGASIAVNGVCLTIETFGQDWFEVYASEETLQITNLQKLKIGNQVNLEPALKLQDSIDGHIVTGHIDTLAKVIKIATASKSKIITLKFPINFANNLINKGSIGLDGVSLTVNKCNANNVEVNIIPETLNSSTLSLWQIGYEANLEFDAQIKKFTTSTTTLNLEMLKNYGY